MCLSMVLFVFMQMWVWSKSGLTCSGYYLPKPHKGSDTQYDNYEIVEGRFLRSVLIIVYSMMGLMVCTAVAVALVYSKNEGIKADNG